MATIAYFLSGWEGVKQALLLFVAIPVGFGAFLGGVMLFNFATEIEVVWQRLLAKTAGVALIVFALFLALAFRGDTYCETPGCRYD